MNDPIQHDNVDRRMMTAAEFWQSLDQRRKTRTEHADYMDFAELYGDYVCDFEKGHDRGIFGTMTTPPPERPETGAGGKHGPE